MVVVILRLGATLMIATEFGEEIVESETNPQTAMMNDDTHAAADDDDDQHQHDSRPKILPTMVTQNPRP